MSVLKRAILLSKKVPTEMPWRSVGIHPRTYEVASCCIRIVTRHVMKTIHASLMGKKLATSSITNSRPPMGLEKAAVTPAADPAEIKSRIFSGSVNALEPRPGILSVLEPPWGTPAPMRAPMWMVGPSAPIGRPEQMPKRHESDLRNMTRMLKICGNKTPFRYDITSGTPEPAAAGKIQQQKTLMAEHPNAHARWWPRPAKAAS